MAIDINVNFNASLREFAHYFGADGKELSASSNYNRWTGQRDMATMRYGFWTGRGKSRAFQKLTPRTHQMGRLAQAALALIRKRVSEARGSDDAPMPPLKSRKRVRWSKSQQKWVEYGSATFGWPRIKTKLGLKPVRDLYGSGIDAKTGKQAGHMLDDIRITSVSDTQARIDIARNASRLKARANETRAPWWGLSPRNVVDLVQVAKSIFSENFLAFQAAFGVKTGGRLGSQFAPLPIWMDPMGIGANAGFVGSKFTQGRKDSARRRAKMPGRQRRAA